MRRTASGGLCGAELQGTKIFRKVGGCGAAGKPAQINCQMRKRLTEVIMQVSCDATALVFLGTHQLTCQGAKIFSLTANGLFISPTFRYVGNESNAQRALRRLH